MSGLSTLLSLIGEMDQEPSYYGNDFGFGLLPHHIHRPVSIRPRYQELPSTIGYSLPLGLISRLNERELNRRAENGEGAKHLSVGKDGFQVCMDVAQFKPSELNVKVVNDCVVVEGNHEEREDEHGHISRHFVRRYTLPKGYDASKVVSTLSSDGVLTVSVPKPPQIEDKSNERVVQIQQTGPAHLNVKQNSQEKQLEANGTSGASGDKVKK